MKRFFILLTSACLLFAACNNSTDNTTDSKTTDPKPQPKDTSSSKQVVAEDYTCSMHPEVSGKKGDHCSKCGMELTVLRNSNQVPAKGKDSMNK
jgi:protein involved in sex pheromone biosynthesis